MKAGETFPREDAEVCISLENHPKPEKRVWPEAQWHHRKAVYDSRVHRVLDPLLEHRLRREAHPVHDFLFTYYRFRPAQLMTWSPGVGQTLEGGHVLDLPFWSAHHDGSGELDSTRFPEKRRESLKWVCHLLSSTARREPVFSCYGLHEWAMLYRAQKARHQVPLRVSPRELEVVVEKLNVRCTHFDAFRFFTAPAVPRNRHRLTRDNRLEFEQPGCVHANMDLYKWAHKFYPWVQSEVILDAFELALEARRLDMQASPYDLTAWGFVPVAIETPRGRLEYEERQRHLTGLAALLRQRLKDELERIIQLLYHECGFTSCQGHPVPA
ncbi:MAG: 3-methyladenine DNA glycosylase [Candidatus Methylacidiphilales bacterium]